MSIYNRKPFSYALIFCLSLIGAACGSAASTQTVAPEQTPATNRTVENKSVVDHSRWEELLKLYVRDDGKVDYDGFTKDRAKLEDYLATVAELDFAALADDDERNALHINAYNAYTILAVVNEVYGKNSSVKNIKGFWDKKK